MALLQSQRIRIAKTGKFAVLLAIVFVFFLPLFSMVLTSLKTMGELFRYPPVIFPEQPQWENYKTAWTMVRFGHFLLNSIVLSIFFTLPCVFSSSFAGYAFSRFHVKGRNAMFMLMLSTMMIPQMVTVIPLYILISKAGLADRQWMWIVFGLQGTPFIIFLFRQYFSTIPISFEESARLDGAGRFRIFFSIMFPLVQTAVIVAVIFAFQWSWADYLQPILFLRGEKASLAVKLAIGYTDQKDNVLHNINMAGLVYYTAPIVIIFFALQKRFISGLLAGGLKG